MKILNGHVFYAGIFGERKLFGHCNGAQQLNNSRPAIQQQELAENVQYGPKREPDTRFDRKNARQNGDLARQMLRSQTFQVQLHLHRPPHLQYGREPPALSDSRVGRRAFDHTSHHT